ncbi:MAG: hypothetical protein VX785_09575 [Actinomycetota bacterium]|nr:hypothetical protein [Acidimicrobiales bacterium]MED5552934.1 hypothetical protein [Actinomycetota bacterium]MEE2680372.1 hypothetical protein [Actinomycetota bacterium]MEE3140095.1 hypothetical protein [Actinomycetota bacterium]MEE3187453.1 hypothetical protein [Actinomycetota bacterium]
MLKRLRWLILGGVFGAGSSVWVRRRVRNLVERYGPVRGTATVVGTARRVGRDLREAWADGQREMRDTETELRREQIKLSDRN